ncbi:MAG: aldolase/citrate lyase family protein [Pseudolabrys sp.]|nr:aldolase/citrate lyase family protein [Pseudolabrys sp.]MDP2295694.1 aldolase/citrate lyase family protein [Pseudolabrys sp.]
MTAFSLAKRLRAGETVFSGWCMMGSPIVAETIAREGFPAVVLDAQHGLWDTASLVAGIGAVHHAGGAAMVRVPLADFGMVSRALDFGAEAIIAPMINTEADARQFAAAAKYPPLGERSFGPPRALMLQGQFAATDYLAAANAGTLTLAMIETPEALSNAGAIAGTPGIDALFIGPYDLATSLSAGEAQDINAPEVDVAIDRICAAALKAGKIPGIYCRDAARALDMARRGFRFLTVGSDFSVVRDGVAASLKTLAVARGNTKDPF